MDNVLPNNPIKLEQLIGATDAVDLRAFADFVAFAEHDPRRRWSQNGPRFAYREISRLSIEQFVGEEDEHAE